MGNIVDGSEKFKTLTEESVAELSTISGFTPEQVSEWHAGFLKDCPTGKLSKQRFIEAWSQFYPSGNPEKYCGHLFRAYDTDSSGYLDFGEYLIAVSMNALEQEPKKKLEWTFSMYDIDSNGFIEKKEMKKIIEAIFEVRGEEITDSLALGSKVDEIFDKMDTDGDGKLSKEEFITGCLEYDNLQKFLVPSAA